ncbi:MAG: T9SS type A sorting domain-containing protein, partial [Bacteroidota bacterium]
IDTSQHQAMFQINYQNVNRFNYRTGAISTYSSNEVRQNSLYFHSFFTDNFALPIKLVYFKAKLNEGLVKLEWATAAEINNNFFTIERSEDGENFLPVLHKQGAGNSTTNLYYNAADQNPITGYSYYRLKQTDYDGHYSYSEIQTIKNGSGDKQESDMTMTIKSVYPNPFITSFKLNFMIKSSVPVDFTLMNTSGQIVAQSKIQAESGYNTYEFLDNKNLEKGIYFAMISYGDEKQIQKIVKN